MRHPCCLVSFFEQLWSHCSSDSGKQENEETQYSLGLDLADWST